MLSAFRLFELNHFPFMFFSVTGFDLSYDTALVMSLQSTLVWDSFLVLPVLAVIDQDAQVGFV